jgi:hypothetical protein
MPYTESGLPFSGATSLSSHASHGGAEHAKGRAATQTIRLLEILKHHPEGLTDWELAQLMQVERTTINARRVPLVKVGLVEADGYRKGHAGIRNTVWRLAR